MEIIDTLSCGLKMSQKKKSNLEFDRRLNAVSTVEKRTLSRISTMTSTPGKIFEYMTLIGKLKQVRRTGWVLQGVKEPESVSDHMYRVAMTAVLAPPPLNADKCVKMALVHDMAECIVGDLTPHDNVSKEEKHRREEEATQHLCSLMGDPVGSQLYALWQEYESQASEEAKFVKDLDRLDMIVQAFEYEQQEQRAGFLQEFFDSTEGKFQTQTVQEWQSYLHSVRRSSLSQSSPQPTCQISGSSSPSAVNQTSSSQEKPSIALEVNATDSGDDRSKEFDVKKKARVVMTELVNGCEDLKECDVDSRERTKELPSNMH